MTLRVFPSLLGLLRRFGETNGVSVVSKVPRKSVSRALVARDAIDADRSGKTYLFVLYEGRCLERRGDDDDHDESWNFGVQEISQDHCASRSTYSLCLLGVKIHFVNMETRWMDIPLFEVPLLFSLSVRPPPPRWQDAPSCDAAK